jgi:hypothetical protein
MDKIVAAAGTGGLPPHAGGKKDKSKQGGKNKTHPKSDEPKCGYCGKKGHLGMNCYINPKSDNYTGKETTARTMVRNASYLVRSGRKSRRLNSIVTTQITSKITKPTTETKYPNEMLHSSRGGEKAPTHH